MGIVIVAPSVGATEAPRCNPSHASLVISLTRHDVASTHLNRSLTACEAHAMVVTDGDGRWLHRQRGIMTTTEDANKDARQDDVKAAAR